MIQVIQPSVSRIAKAIHLHPSDHGRQMTLEEFEQTIDEPGYRFELVKGRIEVSPEPELPHDDDATWIADSIRDYKKRNPKIIGKVSEHARIYVPGPVPTCLQPDIAAFRPRSRMMPEALRKWRFLKAFLVVEVLSPDTAKKDLERNVPLYTQVPSIREYWIVDSRAHLDRPRLIVYRKRGKK